MTIFCKSHILASAVLCQRIRRNISVLLADSSSDPCACCSYGWSHTAIPIAALSCEHCSPGQPLGWFLHCRVTNPLLCAS